MESFQIKGRIDLEIQLVDMCSIYFSEEGDKQKGKTLNLLVNLHSYPHLRS